MPENTTPKREKRCTCSRCKQESRVNGVIRRGEKGEMRAMIRELHQTCTDLGEEIDEAQELIHELTCHCEHDDKQETIN